MQECSVYSRFEPTLVGIIFKWFEFQWVRIRTGGPGNYFKRGRVSNLEGLPQLFSQGSHFGSSCAQATHAVMGAMLTYSLCSVRIQMVGLC